MNFDGDSSLFNNSDAATPLRQHKGVRVLVSAQNTSIESAISHSSIAGKDVPDARIVTLTGLEEVCIVNCD
jgi:hypothetical protein